MYVSSLNVVSREFCVAGSTGLGGTLSVPLGYKKLAVCIGLLNPRPDTLVSNLHLQACPCYLVSAEKRSLPNGEIGRPRAARSKQPSTPKPEP